MATKKATITVNIDAMRVVSHASYSGAGVTTSVSLVIGHSVIANIVFVGNQCTSKHVYLTLPKTIVKEHYLVDSFVDFTPVNMPMGLSKSDMYIWYKECEVQYYQSQPAYAATMRQYHAERAKKYNN